MLVSKSKKISDSEFQKIASNVWKILTKIDLTQCNKRVIEHTTGTILKTCVAVTGSWEGGILIVCPGSLGIMTASAMLNIDQSKINSEDIEDAVGELTNMITGNFLRYLPGGAYLGLPIVLNDKEPSLIIPQGKIICHVEFEYAGQPLYVEVLESENSPIQLIE